jgi:hypothetical protein
MLSLLGTIKKTFSRELSTHLAARLGESENGIRNALGGIVPVVLGGFINKARNDGGRAVFELSQSASAVANGRYDTLTGMLGLLGSGHAPEGGLAAGERLLEMLFGTGSRSIAEPIGNYANIRPASAQALLSLTGAVLPDLLGKYSAQRQMQAKDFAALLLGQKSKVRAMLPPGLSGLTGLLWLGGLGNNSRRLAASKALPRMGRRGTIKALSTWYQVAAGAVGTVLLAFLLLSGGLGEVEGAVVQTGHAAAADAQAGTANCLPDSAAIYAWLVNVPGTLAQ